MSEEPGHCPMCGSHVIDFDPDKATGVKLRSGMINVYKATIDEKWSDDGQEFCAARNCIEAEQILRGQGARGEVEQLVDAFADGEPRLLTSAKLGD